ncbi:MAG: amino acid ABC transporter permease [Alphaproteobacteria bacterium]
MREFVTGDFFFLMFAARWTVAFTVVSILGGGLIGAVIMVLRVLPMAPARAVAIVYINVIQGTPLLGQLFIVFFGLSVFGLNVSPWTAAVVAFSLYAGAFLGEIWRGAVHAVPKTQWEASASIGLSTLEQLRYVIIPQAARISVPPTIGFWVHLVKNTSLASIIGFIELTRAGQIINAATFRPITVYLFVAAAYFVICFVLTRLSAQLEGKLRVAR